MFKSNAQTFHPSNTWLRLSTGSTTGVISLFNSTPRHGPCSAVSASAWICQYQWQKNGILDTLYSYNRPNSCLVHQKSRLVRTTVLIWQTQRNKVKATFHSGLPEKVCESQKNEQLDDLKQAWKRLTLRLLVSHHPVFKWIMFVGLSSGKKQTETVF